MPPAGGPFRFASQGSSPVSPLGGDIFGSADEQRDVGVTGVITHQGSVRAGRPRRHSANMLLKARSALSGRLDLSGSSSLLDDDYDGGERRGDGALSPRSRTKRELRVMQNPQLKNLLSDLSALVADGSMSVEDYSRQHQVRVLLVLLLLVLLLLLLVLLLLLLLLLLLSPLLLLPPLLLLSNLLSNRLPAQAAIEMFTALAEDEERKSREAAGGSSFEREAREVRTLLLLLLVMVLLLLLMVVLKLLDVLLLLLTPSLSSFRRSRSKR